MSRWLGLLGLLLIAASAWIALGLLQPGGPLRDQSGPLRAGWYLRSGQWRADLRTLVAVVAYVVDQDKGAQPQKFPAATAQWREPASTTTA